MMKFSLEVPGRLTAGLISAAILLAACTGCDSTKTTNTEPVTSTLVGEIKINGSSTVLPISNAIREKFIASHPDVDIKVSGDGTGNGFNDFYGKRTDISDASRPIKPGEFDECKQAGVEFIELPVAYDGLTIAVHPENDWASTLSIEQLKKMFVGDNAAKKWKDIDDSWPDEEINIFAPGTGSGTYDYFREVVTKGEEAELRNT